MRQAATGKRQGRRPRRALSARALAAAAMALLLVLQSLFATAAPALQNGHGHPGAIAAQTADCTSEAPANGAPRQHGAGGAHFCILCCAGAGADEVATRPEPHIVIAPPEPPGRREPMERRFAGDDGRPIGFMSSWSPQAPPFVS